MPHSIGSASTGCRHQFASPLYSVHSAYQFRCSSRPRICWRANTRMGGQRADLQQELAAAALADATPLGTATCWQTSLYSKACNALQRRLEAIALVVAVVLASAGTAHPCWAAMRSERSPPSDESFTNIPGRLDSTAKVPEHLSELLKGKSVEDCARKCIGTCIRGGQGAPGLGPMSMRKDIIVFKEGFRTRTYCLSECTQVCALMAKNASK